MIHPQAADTPFWQLVALLPEARADRRAPSVQRIAGDPRVVVRRRHAIAYAGAEAEVSRDPDVHLRFRFEDEEARVIAVAVTVGAAGVVVVVADARSAAADERVEGHAHRAVVPLPPLEHATAVREAGVVAVGIELPVAARADEQVTREHDAAVASEKMRRVMAHFAKPVVGREREAALLTLAGDLSDAGLGSW